MDTYVEDKNVLFRDVFAHLDELARDPVSSPLDEDLLRRAERSLDGSTPRPTLWRVLRTGESLLQVLPQDPKPLTRLLERTVHLIPFDELRSFISTDKLQEGLRAPSIPVQLLCIAYLTKAADRPSGAGFIASSSDLSQLLVTTWLTAESTEVSERALECIVALLAVDSPDNITAVASSSGVGEAQGQGLMWRRMFQDPDMYSLLFKWTSFQHSDYDRSTKKGQQALTISQARLFDCITRIAQLNWAAITTSTIPAVEARYSKSGSGGHEELYGGLLRYASADMIDSSDFLMELLRRDFFMKLLGVVEEQENQQVSPRLLQAMQQDAGVQQAQNAMNGLHL